MTNSAFRYEVVGQPLTRDRASMYAISDRDLSKGLWPTRFHGVHRWVDTDPMEPLHRIQEVATFLPSGAAITGWAAGYLHGAIQLDGRARDGTGLLPVPIGLPREVQTRRRAGLTIMRSLLEPDDVCVIDGIPTARPVRACFDGMRKSSLVEAVVLADAMLHAGLVTPEDLWAYAQRRPRWRGRPLVLQAVPLADARSLSPQETRLRMLWMLEAGLPRPEVNVPLIDTDGHPLGRPDLLDEEAGLVGEYDGATHGELDSRTVDHVREEGMERHGLIVLRFTSLDLSGKYRRRSGLRLQMERARGLRRDRSNDRWRLAR